MEGDASAKEKWACWSRRVMGDLCGLTVSSSSACSTKIVSSGRLPPVPPPMDGLTGPAGVVSASWKIVS